MDPSAVPAKQNPPSLENTIAVDFSGSVARYRGFFSPHAQTVQSAFFACTANM
jgi:hypothetical protein